MFSIFVLERSGVFIEEDSDCSLIIFEKEECILFEWEIL